MQRNDKIIVEDAFDGTCSIQMMTFDTRNIFWNISPYHIKLLKSSSWSFKKIQREPNMEIVCNNETLIDWEISAEPI